MIRPTSRKLNRELGPRRDCHHAELSGRERLHAPEAHESGDLHGRIGHVGREDPHRPGLDSPVDRGALTRPSLRPDEQVRNRGRAGVPGSSPAIVHSTEDGGSTTVQVAEFGNSAAAVVHGERAERSRVEWDRRRAERAGPMLLSELPHRREHAEFVEHDHAPEVWLVLYDHARVGPP